MYSMYDGARDVRVGCNLQRDTNQHRHETGLSTANTGILRKGTTSPSCTRRSRAPASVLQLAQGASIVTLRVPVGTSTESPDCIVESE
mmetsp:Transcript_13298/g.34098  ORF Transcript_13298/g.34098 Transcript_13298/m.34098 type:complete len:88 (+) Transcript_13298:97-360(+)